jgi:hypothetical protein
MKDARTGQLISSELLGNPHYEGTYSVNGIETSFTHDGYSGEVPISLMMNDSFDAKLTATYLSGYTISKDSSDFGWPQGGIQVAARPAGELKLEISGGEEIYSLQKLEEGTEYIAKIFYQGSQLTGKELEKRLDEVYITVNKNAIPDDPQSPFVTSGIRVGTPAATTRGLKEEDFEVIGHLIGLCAKDFENSADYIRAEVTKLCEKYPLY